MSFFGKILIYVDDERFPTKIPDEMAYVICRTYKDAIEKLRFYALKGSKIILDLDHDIQCKQTGYDIAKWVVTNNYVHLRFACHSMNPVGKKNITELLTHYGYENMDWY